jgi:hypothetical protein
LGIAAYARLLKREFLLPDKMYEEISRKGIRVLASKKYKLGIFAYISLKLKLIRMRYTSLMQQEAYVAKNLTNLAINPNSPYNPSDYRFKDFVRLLTRTPQKVLKVIF